MNVLIVDRYSPTLETQLKSLKCTSTRAASLQPTADDLKSTEILMVRSRTKIDATLFEQAPQLKLVVTATAGFDHIDFSSVPASVKVCHTPEANTDSAAELTMLFLLASSRQFAASTEIIRKKKWKDAIQPSRNLKGQHLGLLGFGRVGQRVAELALAHKMHVSVYDPYQTDDAFARLPVNRIGVTELFVQSDYLSLHVPYTKETRHFIRSSTIDMMPHHVVIVNTSRGAVISEHELIQSLEQKRIAGAALDVFETEPLASDSRLVTLPNVITTPHVGAYTEEALALANEFAVLRVSEFLKGGQTQASLPPQAEWAKFL